MPPKRMITDKLRSYGAAKRQVMPNVEHRSHKGLNNRAENSHLPLRKREQMRLPVGWLIATFRVVIGEGALPLECVTIRPEKA